jgi:hypothetical protein
MGVIGDGRGNIGSGCCPCAAPPVKKAAKITMLRTCFVFMDGSPTPSFMRQAVSPA